jgi:hypothetical protein
MLSLLPTASVLVDHSVFSVIPIAFSGINLIYNQVYSVTFVLKLTGMLNV